MSFDLCRVTCGFSAPFAISHRRSARARKQRSLFLFYNQPFLIASHGGCSCHGKLSAVCAAAFAAMQATTCESNWKGQHVAVGVLRASGVVSEARGDGPGIAGRNAARNTAAAEIHVVALGAVESHLNSASKRTTTPGTGTAAARAPSRT